MCVCVCVCVCMCVCVCVMVDVCPLQHKAELLHAVQTLYKMGYKLSGSAGTAEYYSAKGIKVLYTFFSGNSVHLT